MSDPNVVKGSEFLRRVNDLGQRTGIQVSYVPQRGKGSHGTLYYGDKFTVVRNPKDEFTVVRNPKDELKKGTLHGMLKQLGIKYEDL